MKKLLFFFCCFFAFILVVIAQYTPQIQDCKRFTSCSVNNNYSFSNPNGGRLSGARAYVEFVKCSTNTNVGGHVEVCINNDPLSNCPRTECEFSCDPNSTNTTSLGWSYTDCNDVVKIGTIECNYCPQPTPTPDCLTTSLSEKSSTDETANSVPEPCGDSCIVCQQNGGFCDASGNCLDVPLSPIVIDISGNGFDLTNATNGVLFDIDVDNIREQVSWTTANTDDAWLALDRNQNGRIDSGRELFGNFTPQPTPPQGEERNGFMALAEFDKPSKGGNGNNQIDNQDNIFAALLLWQDRNHNGISEQNELQRLSVSPIRVVELDYRESRRTDAHGNQFKYRAKVKDAQGAQVGRWAWDVFLLTVPEN